MQQFEELKFGHFYHIYNHAVGGRNLFYEVKNYEYFLKLYEKYISSVAETYAWVLMKNHFHLLVRIKEESDVVGSFTPDRVSNPVRGKITTMQFSKLFNAYAQAFNKYHQERGALFERPFKRKLITNDDYLKQVILYIHNNPVHHGFCKHPIEYPWTSYLTCISKQPTNLKRDTVIEWFFDRANFIAVHEQKIDRDGIEGWLES